MREEIVNDFKTRVDDAVLDRLSAMEKGVMKKMSTETKKPVAWISQPMRGVSPEEVILTNATATAKLEELGYETCCCEFDEAFLESESVKNKPLAYLGQSLSSMATCDAIYLCKGWENARGCKIERIAALAYGLKVLKEEEI